MILFVAALLAFCAHAWAQESPVRVVDSSFSVSADTTKATFVYAVMVANDLPCDVRVTLTCGRLDDDDNFIDGMTQTYSETLHAGELKVITGTFVFPITDIVAYRYNFMGYKSTWELLEACHEIAI